MNIGYGAGNDTPGFILLQKSDGLYGSLCEMQIGYLAECRPGDLLTLQVGEQGEGRYVRGIDAGGNSRFEAALFFGEVLP